MGRRGAVWLRRVDGRRRVGRGRRQRVEQVRLRRRWRMLGSRAGRSGREICGGLAGSRVWLRTALAVLGALICGLLPALFLALFFSAPVFFCAAGGARLAVVSPFLAALVAQGGVGAPCDACPLSLAVPVLHTEALALGRLLAVFFRAGRHGRRPGNCGWDGCGQALCSGS